MSKQKIYKLLIGTNNRGKLKEIKSLLPKKIKIHSTSEFNLKSPVENGKTFKENSLIKSRYFSKKTINLKYMTKSIKKIGYFVLFSMLFVTACGPFKPKKVD